MLMVCHCPPLPTLTYIELVKAKINTKRKHKKVYTENQSKLRGKNILTLSIQKSSNYETIIVYRVPRRDEAIKLFLPIGHRG